MIYYSASAQLFVDLSYQHVNVKHRNFAAKIVTQQQESDALSVRPVTVAALRSEILDTDQKNVTNV
jgi:hypothetical protein